MLHRPRIYLDSSVIGGCYDEEFSEDSKRLIGYVNSGQVIALISEVVVREILAAPSHIQNVLTSISGENIERVELTTEILDLRDAYLNADVLHPRWKDDLLHVAASTISRADAIASWNFKHIVRLDKMRAYNEVNLANGYGNLMIITPKEVRYDEQ